MLWAVFALLAGLLWGVTNVVDKYVLTKWIKRPIVPVILLAVFGIIASGIIYVLRGLASLSSVHLLLSFAAGASYILMNFFYFRATKIEEISRVSPLFYLSNIFIVVMAVAFLDEILAPIKYLGVFLIVSGAIMISSRKLTKISLGKAFWLMILCSFSLAVSSVITKYLLNFADYWTVFSYTKIGALIAALPIIYRYLPDLRKVIREKGKRVVGVMSGNELIRLSGVLSMTVAMSLGFVSLVSALASLQPFFVLLMMVGLSLFRPGILKEEIGKSVVSMKIIAIVLMFVGVYLIA